MIFWISNISAGVEVPPVLRASTQPGEGVTGMVDDQMVFVGRRSWVENQLQSSNHAPSWASSHDDVSGSQVWVGVDREGLVGKLVIGDELRDDARDVVQELLLSGKRIILLSGDEEGVARSVGEDAGIDVANVFGRMRPEGKANFVKELQENGACVAMIGDGVNDAVALGAADVGIAMGGGTDAAGAAAGVVLMGDRLGQSVEALQLGKDTVDKIKQNLGLAVVYNVVGIPIAAGALLPSYGIALSPTVAAGMMACSSIVVVLNSLTLRRWKTT